LLLQPLLERIGYADVECRVTAAREDVNVIHGRCGVDLPCSIAATVVMGPCVRRDDERDVVSSFNASRTTASPRPTQILRAGPAANHCSPLRLATGARVSISAAASSSRPRKTPGSFLPGVLLEVCQTIGIRSCAERER